MDEENTMSKNMVPVQNAKFSILEPVVEESKQDHMTPPKAPKLKPKYKLS